MRKPNDNLAIRSIKFRFVLRPHSPKAVNSITNLIILMNTLYFYKLNTHRFMSSRLYILNFGRTKNESKSVLQRCNSSMTTWCHAPLLRGQNHAWAWFWNSPNLAFLFGSQNYKWRLFFTYLSGVGYKDAFLCPLDYIKTHFNNVKLVKLFRRVGTKWIRQKITFHTESPMVNDKQEQWIRQNNCTLHIAHCTITYYHTSCFSPTYSGSYSFVILAVRLFLSTSNIFGNEFRSQSILQLVKILTIRLGSKTRIWQENWNTQINNKHYFEVLMNKFYHCFFSKLYFFTKSVGSGLSLSNIVLMVSLHVLSSAAWRAADEELATTAWWPIGISPKWWPNFRLILLLKRLFAEWKTSLFWAFFGKWEY